MSFGKILKKVIVDRHVKKLYKSLSNDPVIKDIDDEINSITRSLRADVEEARKTDKFLDQAIKDIESGKYDKK